MKRRQNHARGANHCVVANLPPSDTSQLCQCLVHLHLLCSSPWQQYSSSSNNSNSCKTPFTRYNLLSNRLSIRFDNRLNVCIHDTYNRLYNRLSNRLSIRFDNRLYIVYTNIQPVVKPVSNWLYNRFDNRLHLCYTMQQVVNAVWQPFWQPVRLYHLNGLSNSVDTISLKPVVKPNW